MELRLTKIHDEDKNYRVRICMEKDSLLVRHVVPGSIVRECDECDSEVWYNPHQPIPDMEDVIFEEEEILLCLPCLLLHQLWEDERQ